MSTIYSIAIKLSLDGVNQLKNSFSIATQEIKKSSIGITGIVSNSAKQMKELTNNSIVQAVRVGTVIAGMTKAIKTGIEFEDTFLRATAKIKGGVKQGSEEFNKLEALVLDLGAKTEFSTSEAAQGLDFSLHLLRKRQTSGMSCQSLKQAWTFPTSSPRFGQRQARLQMK